jgi:adenine-specific DNA-methyltransferase
VSEALSVTENIPSQTLTQKELGAYYTPLSLTSVLSKWAIRSSNEDVLEPSFGGCGFLQSAVARLNELGCKQGHVKLYGCDIDPRAFEFLSQRLNAIENVNKRFLHKDFLEVTPDEFSVSNFPAIIANPPYISRHNFSVDQEESVRKWRKINPTFKLSMRASLWAYFLLHSMSFLAIGGRMAWVLPGSFLQTDYGKELQVILLDKFGKLAAFDLGERAFSTEGTEERTVVLLCDLYGQTSEKIQTQYCESLDNLEAAITGSLSAKYFSKTTIISTDSAQQVFENITNRDDACSIGDVARILIGTVTGANKFFILSPSQINKYGIDEKYVYPILSKFSYITGLDITEEDFSNWKASDYRCMILHLDDESEALGKTKVYTDTFDKLLKANNETFKKRTCWLASDDKRIPDGFFSYMNDHGPRISLNSAGINSTNSIHRIFFNKNITIHQRKLVAITLYTSFSQLSAELEGRSYGSGVLKLEPSGAKVIKIVLPKDKTSHQVNVAAFRIDALLRQCDYFAVEQYANEFIFGNSIEAQEKLIEPLRARLVKLRNQRR